MVKLAYIFLKIAASTIHPSMKQLSFLCIILLLCSCSRVVKTGTTRTTDINGAGILHKPVVADMEVRETKVSGSALGRKKDGMESVRQAALKDALQKSNADVLVEPSYETECKGKKINATVSGWPANYKNFRTIKTEDIDLLKAGKKYSAKTSTQKEEVNKKKGPARAVRIALGVATSLLLVFAFSAL